MKKLTLLIVLFFIGQSLFAQDELIIGTWQSVDEEDTMLFTFDPEGYAVLNFKHESIGGKSYLMDGIECSLRYKLDLSKSPAWIDFLIILKEDGSEFDFMLGIGEFLNESTELKICFDFYEGNKRPKSFIADDTVKLIKLTEN